MACRNTSRRLYRASRRMRVRRGEGVQHMKRFIIAAFAIAAMAMTVAPGSADEHELGGVTKSYVGVAGDITVVCPDPISDPVSLTLPGIGGNCFDVSTMGRSITVLVDDALVDMVGYTVGYYGPDGRIGDLVPGCGGSFHLLPPDTTMIRVFVGVFNGPAGCESGLPSNVGLTGQITVAPVFA